MSAASKPFVDAADVRARLDLPPPFIPRVYGYELEMLPFRAREVIRGAPRSMDAINQLLGMISSGTLSAFEYAHSALAIASKFRVDPAMVLTGVDISGAELRVFLSDMTPPLPRAAFKRFVRYLNALVEALDLEEWHPSSDYIDSMTMEILARYGSVDRYKLGSLLATLRFKLDSQSNSRYGVVELIYGALSSPSPSPSPFNAQERPHILLPGEAFKVTCADLGVEGAAAASVGLPKALGHLVGSGDLVELMPAGARPVVRRLLLSRGLAEPEESEGRLRSLGELALDCEDAALERLREKLSMVRVAIADYRDPNPSLGVHVLFPQVEDGYVELNTRACPTCGSITYGPRCPTCGSITEPARACPTCGSITVSEVCERCGTPTRGTRRFRVSFSKEVSSAARSLGLRQRGVEVVGERESPGGPVESPSKGLLRQMYGLRVYCDGTTRASATLIHARIPDCTLMIPTGTAKVLYEVTKFVDAVAKVFSSSPPYNLQGYEELLGKEVVLIPQGGYVGYVARISGFSPGPVSFVGSALPAGDVTISMLWDVAWNMSLELARARFSSCRLGVPLSLVSCGGDADIPTAQHIAEAFVPVEGGLSPGVGGHVAMVHVLERNLEVLRSLELSAAARAPLCKELGRALLTLEQRYLSSGYICEACWYRSRRPTLSGSCPICGGRMSPATSQEDLEAIHLLASAADDLCDGGVTEAVLTADRIAGRTRQARLVDYI